MRALLAGPVKEFLSRLVSQVAHVGCLFPPSPPAQIREEFETQEATEISSSFPCEILPNPTISLTAMTEVAASRRGAKRNTSKLACIGASHLESRGQGQKVQFTEITKYMRVRLEMEIVEVVRIFFPFLWVPDWRIGEGQGRRVEDKGLAG